MTPDEIRATKAESVNRIMKGFPNGATDDALAALYLASIADTIIELAAQIAELNQRQAAAADREK